ncbi:MAG: hypothetical protein QM757_14815 [Paludibaculum sp.]
MLEHRKPGDLFIDWDLLAVALGSDVDHGHAPGYGPWIEETRHALLQRLTRTASHPPVWITRGAPTLRERSWYRSIGAHVVLLPTPADVCIARARAASRPASWPDLIADWWDRYEPDAVQAG